MSLFDGRRLKRRLAWYGVDFLQTSLWQRCFCQCYASCHIDYGKLIKLIRSSQLRAANGEVVNDISIVLWFVQIDELRVSACSKISWKSCRLMHTPDILNGKKSHPRYLKPVTTISTKTVINSMYSNINVMNDEKTQYATKVFFSNSTSNCDTCLHASNCISPFSRCWTHGNCTSAYYRGTPMFHERRG